MSEDRKIQELRNEADKVTGESLESTRRMKALALETEQVGGATLKNLGDQGEQLNRIERGLDNINQNVAEAESEIEELEKCCGCCVCPWNKSKKFKKRKFKETSSVQPERAQEVSHGNHGNSISEQPERPVMRRIIGDAREDEMEENLNDISGIVGNLRAQAQEMHTTLSQHNQQLDRIDAKLSHNVERVEAAGTRTARLLK